MVISAGKSQWRVVWALKSEAADLGSLESGRWWGTKQYIRG